MAVNKVVYNGSTLVDLTADTVSEDTLLQGVTAHNAAGEAIVGIAVGNVEIDPVLELISTSTKERVTSTTGRYWEQTGSTYKVLLKKYRVTKGAKYTIQSTAKLAYATAWFGDEWPVLEDRLNYVGLSNTQKEWTIEATGNLMMVSFTNTSTIASSVMTVRIAAS